MKALAIFFLFSSLLFAQSKQILLLQSYNKGLKWSDDISLGLESELKKASGFELTTEYLDSKKNHSNEYKKTIYDIFLKKLKLRTYDIVIIADNYAIDFYKKYENELFLNAKIIFIGVDKDFYGFDLNQTLSKNIPVVLENKKLIKNIEFIYDFIDDLEQIYIINDTSYSSKIINKKFKHCLTKFKNLRLNIEGNLTKIALDIKALPKNSAVLFGSLFVDKKGVYLPYYEVNQMINNSTHPIFSLTNSHLQKGVVGGLLSTGFEQGSEAGKIVLKYLNGLHVSTNEPILANAKWMFDYNILKKYNLLNKALPKNSVILNKPKSFFEKNKSIINISFVVFPLIFTMMLFIIFIIAKKNLADKKLLEQKYLAQKQLDFMQDLIFWVDKNTNIIACNDAFANFVKMKKQNIKNINSLPKYLKIQNFLHVNSYEFSYKNKTYLVKNSFISYEENQTNLFVISDITDTKNQELNNQFLIQQSKLSEIGQMLSSLTHQWKAPLVELSVVAHKMHHYNKTNKLTNEKIELFSTP